MPDLPYRSATDRRAVQAFFEGRPEAWNLFRRLAQTVATWGPVEVVASPSRVAFKAHSRFAWVHEASRDGAIHLRWLLPHALDSARIRSSPLGDRWSHGAKVYELDAELLAFVREAYEWDVEAEETFVLPRRRPGRRLRAEQALA
jgi:hypothetical protein